jgi:SAM-dependent methyltransferase
VGIPERYRWAVNILNVRPHETILEIGCGYGHSIALICEKLATGHLTAIDRSEKMIASASAAYQNIIDTGRVEILHQDVLDRRLPEADFDKIFLFNINVFWMDPRDELAEIRRLLKPDGRFFLFHQPPPGHDLEEFENAFRSNLEKNGFSGRESFKDQRKAIRSIALVARPSRR